MHKCLDIKHIVFISLIMARDFSKRSNAECAILLLGVRLTVKGREEKQKCWVRMLVEAEEESIYVGSDSCFLPAWQCDISIYAIFYYRTNLKNFSSFKRYLDSALELLLHAQHLQWGLVRGPLNEGLLCIAALAFSHHVRTLWRVANCPEFSGIILTFEYMSFVLT